ncbi:MAG: glycosyltransferase family 39 protein [Chloroflexi bacterium]|nr:glycosyltransferase family 39 protein [Chloroflexota bacterium]
MRYAIRYQRVALLLIIVTAAAAPYAIANRVYQRLPRLEDELAEWYQARVFASGRLYAASPAEPLAFGVPFVIDRDGRRFSKYPPGHALLLAIGVWLGDPWIVGPLVGALTIALVYRLGRELFGARLGLLAAGLGVTSPFYLILTASLMPHSASLLFAALFGLGVWRLRMADGRLQIAERTASLIATGAGAALGFVFIIRPFTAACLSIPFILAAIRQRDATINYQAPISRPASHLSLLTSLIPAALLLLYNYAVTGELRLTLYTLWWPYDRLGFGPDIGPTGFTIVQSISTTAKNLFSLTYDLHGVVFLSPIFVGLALLLTPRRRVEFFLALIPAALVVGHAFYFHGSRLYGPRYYYEALPALLILSARGIQKSAAHVARLAPRLGRWPIYAVAVGFLVFDLAFFLPFRLRLLAGLYDGALDWDSVRSVERAGLHGAIIFLFADDWPEAAAGIMQNDPALTNDVIYARYLGPDSYRRARAAHPDRAAYFFRDGELTPAADPPPEWYPKYPTVRPPGVD